MVAIGNALLCVVYGLLARRPAWHVPAMLAGAVVKCAFLWLTVPLVLAAASLPEQQTNMCPSCSPGPRGSRRSAAAC